MKNPRQDSVETKKDSDVKSKVKPRPLPPPDPELSNYLYENLLVRHSKKKVQTKSN